MSFASSKGLEPKLVSHEHHINTLNDAYPQPLVLFNPKTNSRKISISKAQALWVIEDLPRYHCANHPN